MSSVRYALENLDLAITRLDESVLGAETALHGYEAASASMVDADILAFRIDRAIDTVEALLAGEI